MADDFQILVAYFKVGLAKHFYYRTSIFLGVFARAVGLMFMIMLWSKIFENRTTVGGRTLSTILVYYLFAYIARTVANPNIATTIGERIKAGDLQMYIIRPGHVLLSFFAMPVSKRVYELTVFLIIACVILFIGFPIYGLEVGQLHFGLFGIFMMLGVLINFFIASIVAASAFWIVECMPLLYGLNNITSILAGLVVPLYFFPTWAQRVTDYLPFRYAIYDPVLALQGELTGGELIHSFGLAIIWILILAIINGWVWRIGTKRFDAVGN